MDGNQAKEGLRADIAAALAESGVASLDRAGAPVLIAEGDGFRLVHANAAALALFGADSLADLGERVFASAAAVLADRIGAFSPGMGRIERFGFGGDAPKLTFLCRRATTDAKLFVLAGLGLRPRGALASRVAAALTQAPAVPDTCADLKRAFARRYPDLKPARFLWRTDARNVVTEVTPPLAEIFGGAAAALVGSDLTEVARSLGMDPDRRLLAALKGRATFSGIEVIWPIAGATAAAPVSLGALPAFDREKGFDGWRGFGVIQLDRLREFAPPQASPEIGEPAREAPAPDTSGVVLPFPPARGGAVAEIREEPAALVTLAPHERQAFREIARTLGAHGESHAEADPGEAGADAQHREGPPDAAAPEVPSDPFFDEWPFGLAIRQNGEWVRANRTLLGWLGLADEAEFCRAGRLDAFHGPLAARGLAVAGEMAPALWRGAPAEAVVISRAAQPQDTQLQDKVSALQASLRQRETEAADVAAILEASADGVALFNADGELLGLNAAAEKLFGRARDESGNLRDLIAPEGQAVVAATLARLASGQPAPSLRLACESRSGGTLTLQTSFARMSGGRKFCAVFRNPAPAGETGQALRDARVRAEVAEAESRAKTDYLTAVTHEIRTPLNAILGFTEVIMDERFGPVGNARYKEYLKDIHASGAHVMSLVNDLLDLSKIEAGKLDLVFAAVDANQVVAECVSLIQPQANRERVITRLALAPGLPPALADERSLRQIVLNLLANAVRYNEPGGQVIVSTSLVSTGGGDRVLLRVKDTGVGMSDSEMVSALEPFRQASSKAGGTGLGLPLTKALAEANQAEFVIRSRKNEGTLVEVGFPRAPAMEDVKDADASRAMEKASR
jgi:PAS domain S-box-containing protein